MIENLKFNENLKLKKKFKTFRGKGFTACLYSFPSGHGETYPKSGRDLVPDKPGCPMSCLGGVSDQMYCTLFTGFLSPIPYFANQP